MNGRDKLKQLGIELPLLPITAVGSYGKPDALRKARTAFERGRITRDELKAQEEEATAMWMGFQNEIGVDVPVDGEMYRGDMVAYFAEEMDGFETGGLVRAYGNRFYRKPIITSQVRWRGPMTVDWWRYAQSLTEKPVKGMLTGGYTVMDWSFNEHYPNRRDTALALAGELRKEVEALVEAGCKIVQIDEPAVSVRADEIDVALEAMAITTDGIDAYFVTHALEYGYPESVFPDVLGLQVDNFDMEFAELGLQLPRGTEELRLRQGPFAWRDRRPHPPRGHRRRSGRTHPKVDRTTPRRVDLASTPIADSRPAPLKSRWTRCAPSRIATKAFGNRYDQTTAPRTLEGLVAIVTGSSRGMGRGTAAHLASLGAKVAVCYVRSKDMAEELVNEIENDGGEAGAFGADITNRGRREVAHRRSGRPIRLRSTSSCATWVASSRNRSRRRTTDEWYEQFAQNTDTMFFCITAALPAHEEAAARADRELLGRRCEPTGASDGLRCVRRREGRGRRFLAGARARARPRAHHCRTSSRRASCPTTHRHASKRKRSAS